MSDTGTAVATAMTPAVDEPTAIAESPREVSMFERLVSDPNVDVEKLERLMAMQERVIRYRAEQAFNEAFAAMQPEIPVIAAKASLNACSAR